MLWVSVHFFNIRSPALVISVTGTVALECSFGADTASVVSLSMVSVFFFFYLMITEL